VPPRRTWQKVNRIWTIRTDGTQRTKIHTRTMSMEIFGHEILESQDDHVAADE
jgi:hypothetical protein